MTTDAIALLKDNAPYYLVETDAPDGYMMLTEPLKVTIDMTGHNTWTKLRDNSTSQTKPDPYELSNWLQEAIIKVTDLEDNPSAFAVPGNGAGAAPAYDYQNDTTEASIIYRILNLAGIELPSTGGIGTIPFRLPGILIACIATAGLVVKKRKSI